MNLASKNSIETQYNSAIRKFSSIDCLEKSFRTLNLSVNAETFPMNPLYDMEYEPSLVDDPETYPRIDSEIETSKSFLSDPTSETPITCILYNGEGKWLRTRKCFPKHDISDQYATTKNSDRAHALQQQTAGIVYPRRTLLDMRKDMRAQFRFRCYGCQMDFETFSESRIHVISYHYCLTCSIYFSSTLDFEMHNENEHLGKISCGICSDSNFSTVPSLGVHVMLRHPFSLVTKFRNCDFSDSGNPAAFLSHMRRHSGCDGYLVDECGLTPSVLPWLPELEYTLYFCLAKSASSTEEFSDGLTGMYYYIIYCLHCRI